MHGLAVAVAEHLDLDVAGADDESLEVQRRIAEGGPRLALRQRKLLGQACGIGR